MGVSGWVGVAEWVWVGVAGWVCPQKYLKNASSRVAKAFTDVIVNEKQST